MEKPVGIIGGGNMGEALIAGIIQSGLLTPREILFHEPRPDRDKVPPGEIRSDPRRFEFVTFPPGLRP